MNTMTELQKIREEQDKAIEDFNEAKSVLSSVKADVTIMAVAALFRKVDESVNELLEVSAKKEYFDKDLCKTIESTLSKAIEVFSKIEAPVINVAAPPPLNLQPLQSIAAEIKNQGKSMIGLMEQMKEGNNSDELMRLLMAVANRQIAFMEKFQQVDNSPQLNSINETLNNNRPEKLIIKRDDQWRMTEVIPVYKK